MGSGYYIGLVMKVIMGVCTLFAAIEVLAQFVAGKPFFSNELGLGEIIILVIGLSLGWAVAFLYRPWARFIDRLF